MQALLLAVLLLATPAPALAFVALEGELDAREACPAWVSFRRQENPDGAELTPGRRYRVLGRNRPGGDWLQVLVPDAEPPRRWVAVSCGALVQTAPAAASLLPFFDTRAEGPPDPAPPPPPLTALDRAVLEVCGSWGSRPRRRAFRAMLDRPDLAPELEALAADLGEPLTRRLKDELARVWFDADGFAHVFCGEPRPGELSGLHYRGRYLELQEKGLIGRAEAAACRPELDPPVYTLGVRYRPPGGGPWQVACPKGYAADLGAAELLALGLRVARAQRGGEGMCLLERESRAGRYTAVVVLREGAMRTFYPDASPRCDGGGRPASCACGG